MSDEVVSQFQAAPEQEEKKASRVLKFGIIGTGWIAESHAKVLLEMENAEVTCMADLIPGKAEKFCVKQGFDLEMLDALAARVDVPVIASGGAGKIEDFQELFRHPGIDAGLAASIFHTRQVDIRELKRALRAGGVEVRL